MAKVKRTFEEGYALAMKEWEESSKDAESLEKLEMELEAFPQCAGFWYHNPKIPNRKNIWGKEDPLNDYKFILTRFEKGYLKAIDDLRNKLNEKGDSKPL